MWVSFLGNILLDPVALVPTSCNSCGLWCWNNLLKRLHSAGVAWWISCSNCIFALCQSASDRMVGACWALIRRTSNSLRLVVVTVSAMYTRTPIAAWILWIFCLCNWLHSLANCSCTVVFTRFHIFYSRKVPFVWQNPFSALCSAVRDRSKWFCWLTSWENEHNDRTAPITISSEDVSAAVFWLSLEE